jgi:hypothetical protein
LRASLPIAVERPEIGFGPPRSTTQNCSKDYHCCNLQRISSGNPALVAVTYLACGQSTHCRSHSNIMPHPSAPRPCREGLKASRSCSKLVTAKYGNAARPLDRHPNRSAPATARRVDLAADPAPRRWDRIRPERIYLPSKPARERAAVPGDGFTLRRSCYATRRRSPRALTSPASWIAPPNSSNFSVNVVLPASGCEMMANVRRRAMASVKVLVPNYGVCCASSSDGRWIRRRPGSTIHNAPSGDRVLSKVRSSRTRSRRAACVARGPISSTTIPAVAAGG